jgi:hypothetical protein
MFVFTAQDLIDKFTRHIESGVLQPDDLIALEYWAFEDVISVNECQDDYFDVTDEVAREVWAAVARTLNDYENIDNDQVRYEISLEIDKRRDTK